MRHTTIQQLSGLCNEMRICKYNAKIGHLMTCPPFAGYTFLNHILLEQIPITYSSNKLIFNRAALYIFPIYVSTIFIYIYVINCANKIHHLGTLDHFPAIMAIKTISPSIHNLCWGLCRGDAAFTQVSISICSNLVRIWWFGWSWCFSSVILV